MSTPAKALTADYSTVTEVPGVPASAEQLSMIHTRYRLAHDLAEGKDVLEVACGCGWGLGFLAGRAKTVIGGDYTASLVDIGNRHYAGRIRIEQMDAQRLPFEAGSFDLVLMFEALYYLEEPARFAAEAFRVLRPGGKLVISTVNLEWGEFNPSPFSHKYLSAKELHELLAAAGFAVELKAGFPVARDTAASRLIAGIRRAAVTMGLMPKTMKGKALLKRIFCGRLKTLSSEIDTSVPAEPLIAIRPGPLTSHKVLYAIAQRLV